MILIGEKLNSSIPKTMEAFSAHDEAAVIGLIQAQADAGAEYLDVNTAICGGEELAAMLWVVALIREHSSCGIMIDTADPLRRRPRRCRPLRGRRSSSIRRR